MPGKNAKGPKSLLKQAMEDKSKKEKAAVKKVADKKLSDKNKKKK